MRILGVKNLMAKILVFTWLIYFYAAAETISSEVEDSVYSVEEEEDKTFIRVDFNEAFKNQTKLAKRVYLDLKENERKMTRRMGDFETVLSTVKGGQKVMNDRMGRLETMVSTVDDRQEKLEKQILSDARESQRQQQQLHQKISLVSKAVDSFLANLAHNYYRKSSDCGGILELVRGAPSGIRYANPGSTQRCVWKIDPEENFAAYGIKFESIGAETRLEGVKVNYWKSPGNIRSHAATEFGSWIPIPAPYVFITFCPNPSKVNAGFEASIHGFGNSEDTYNSKPSWFWDSSEKFDFSVSNELTECIATQKPLTFSTVCGGNVELARGFPSTIRYANPGNNTNCAWTIIITPEVQFASYGIKLESLGKETRVEGVSFNYWDEFQRLQSQAVTEFGSWIPIPAPYIFITFCPNPSNVNAGFEASVIGFGTSSSEDNFKPSWFGNSTETFDFSVSDKFTECIAIQTPLTNSTECGGNVELGRGVPSTIHHANGDNKTSCEWTIIPPEVPFASYGIKFESLGTETRVGGVRVNYWDNSAKLQTKIVYGFGSWISIPSPYIFITFCPYPHQANASFEASIIGFGTSSNAVNFKPSWFGNSTEAFDYSISDEFTECIAIQTPFTNLTGCGGNLEVARGVPSIIHYQNLGNNQNCVWKIAQQADFASYGIKLKPLVKGTKTVGVLVYFGNSTAEIQTQEIKELGYWVTIPGPNALITFCSNPSRFTSGFEASIIGFGTSSSVANLNSSWFGNSTEAFNFLLSENFSHCIGTENPWMTSTACGGILEVARGIPSTIYYPNYGNYDRQRCVWAIAAKDKFASYYIKIELFHLDVYYDGVKIYFWDSGAELQSQKVTRFDSWIYIPAPYVVITFCSPVGRGFGASIVGWGTSTDPTIFRPFWLTNSTESFSYPQNTSSTESNNEMVSVVIQPPRQQNVTVSVSAPHIGNDTIKPYQLTCNYYRSENPTYSLKERSDGGNSSSATYQFGSQIHPFLVIFKSNAGNDGVRFTISY